MSSSITSEKIYSKKGNAKNQVKENLNTVINQMLTDQLEEHFCPCDEKKNQDLLDLESQCLCEEINLEYEVILFFYHSILTNEHVGDYWFESPCIEINDLSIKSADSKKMDDLKRGSEEVKRNILTGANESVMTQRIKRKSSRSMPKENSSVSTKPPKISSNLNSITEDNMAESSTGEKLISSTDFEPAWLVKREEKYAKIRFKNGNRYRGEVSDKVPHGYGVYEWSDGTVYQGEFERGSPSGTGKMVLPDLSEYTGAFHKGYFHGEGVYNIRNTNMVYRGSWKYGKKHGFGWLMYDTDVWYEGEFMEDLRHGKGFYRFKNKSCYQGEYSKNRREGRGVMRWYNNDIYIGEWLNGEMSGQGEYTWSWEPGNCLSFPVRHHYNGSWLGGKRNGMGVMFFGNENGAKMAGFFQDNFKHGAAVVICGDGRSVEKNPLFANDKPTHAFLPSGGSSAVAFNEPYKKEDFKRLCSPIEIQIQSQPDDVELEYYIEKALGMYMNAYDTIQFDMDSTDSCSSAITSKWNLMTNNSVKQDVPASIQPICNRSERYRSTVSNEDKYLRNVIGRHLSALTEVYYHYATITSPKKEYFKHYMIRMHLWQLYVDVGVTESGVALAETDAMLDENPAGFVESRSDPFEHVYFFQFLQSLIGTSLLVHRDSREEIGTGEGVASHIFQKFLVERVFPRSGRHKGRCLFEYKDLMPIKDVYGLYKKLGRSHTARTFLNATCVKRGEDPPCYKAWSDGGSPDYSLGYNVSVTGRNFIYVLEKDEFSSIEQSDPFFQDLSAFRVLGPKKVVQCLASVCPPLLKDGLICDMNYPLTFLEFYEVLICCALLMMAWSKKRKELVNRLISYRSNEEDAQVEFPRKPSGKFKRKK